MNDFPQAVQARDDLALIRPAVAHDLPQIFAVGAQSKDLGFEMPNTATEFLVVVDGEEETDHGAVSTWRTKTL